MPLSKSRSDPSLELQHSLARAIDGAPKPPTKLQFISDSSKRFFSVAHDVGLQLS